jgi:hypothetical protein
MKKNIIYIILATAFTLSCTKEEEQGPANLNERLSGVLSAYQQQLVSSPYGWKAAIYPVIGGGANFYLQFSSEGRVTMMSDMTLESASDAMESSYRLDVLQAPSLIFDTYSYLHLLSDPDPDVAGGITASGYVSDFEFAFQSSTYDTIKLVGNQHGTALALVRATRKESERYTAGRMNAIILAIHDHVQENPFLFLIEPNHKKTSINLSEGSKTFSLAYEQDETLAVSSSKFIYTTEGIRLQNPLTYNSFTFNEVFMDTASNKIYIESPEGLRIDATTGTQAVFPMHKMIGVGFDIITLPPDPENFPGWSAPFKSTWISMDDELSNYQIRLSDIQIMFDVKAKKVDFVFYIRDVSNGVFVALRYPCSYTQTTDGVFKFIPFENDELSYYASLFLPVTNILLSKIFTDNFTMSYLNDGGASYTGQLISVEQPSFYFSGRLK